MSRTTSRAATCCTRNSQHIDADTYLVELKAAVIDVVVEHALANGRRVVLAGNEVVSDGLDDAVLGAPPAGGTRMNDVRSSSSWRRDGHRQVHGRHGIAYKLGIRRLPRRTRSGRRCGRSSRRVHADDPLLELLGRRGGRRRDDPLVAGFLEQSRNVLVGVNASIERALQEGWSIIFEGVPPSGAAAHADGGRARLPVRPAIEDEDEHARHFFSRSAGSERPLDEARPRPPERYPAPPDVHRRAR